MQEFPNDFAFGVATSAYQIEGGWNLDGKGPSIWDTFSRIPGNIKDGSNGDVACDHYNLWEQDVELMKRLGIANYRFSISWSRILPDGTGRVEPRGLDFYDRLVDKLLVSGITPWVTLYHFDLPQELEDKGGWPNRETADHFANYADIVSKNLGDRVKNWITINEPSVAGYDGYVKGVHAPGRKDLKVGLSAIHTMLLAHGSAIPIIRNNVSDARIGLALFLVPTYPDTESFADRQAALRQDGYKNRWQLNPLFKAQYPADMIKVFGEENVPEIKPGDFEIIGTPLDFLGVNYYFPLFVKNDPNNLLLKATSVDRPDMGHTDMGWLVYPKGLSDTLRRVSVEYPEVRSLYITENGAAFTDELKEGVINDVRRIDYMDTHIKEALIAIKEGIPLRGYFLWSLMDNSEWAEGYTKKFGIITRQRIIKESGYRYKEIITNNSLKIIA